MAHEKTSVDEAEESTGALQKLVLKTPAVWILAGASAFMYIARYAINGWGVLFLQEQKGFSLTEATTIISVNALLGIFGTVLSGWVSDKLFRSDRYVPAFIFGAMNSVALALFLFNEATGQMVQATQYDFTPVAIFWVVASVISFLLPVLNWKYRK